MSQTVVAVALLSFSLLFVLEARAQISEDSDSSARENTVDTAVEQKTDTAAETTQPSAVEKTDSATSTPPAAASAVAFDPLRTTVYGSLRSEMFFSSRTQMKTTEPGVYERDNLTVFPFYEIVDVHAVQLGHPGLSVHVKGVAGLDLAEVYFDQRFVADPTLVYVQFQDFGLDARLGRQLVFSGVSEGLHLDGLYASYRSPLFVGIEAFGGLVVSPKQGPDWYATPDADPEYSDFGRGFSDWNREGDYAAGGRIFYEATGKVSAGVSFMHVTNLSELDRQLLGVDLDITPVKWLGIFGNLDIDLPASRIREGQADADFYILKLLRLNAHYRHTDPSLYISKMSLFSVFSMEAYDSVGASVLYKPLPRLSVIAGYDQLFHTYSDSVSEDKERELGYEINADGVLEYGRRLKGTGRAGFRHVFREGLGIDQIRLGATIPLGMQHLRAAVNAYMDFYQEEVNDKNLGFLGDLGVFYSGKALETGASVTAGTTPFSTAEVRGMLRFAWNFNATRI